MVRKILYNFTRFFKKKKNIWVIVIIILLSIGYMVVEKTISKNETNEIEENEIFNFNNIDDEDNNNSSKSNNLLEESNFETDGINAETEENSTIEGNENTNITEESNPNGSDEENNNQGSNNENVSLENQENDEEKIYIYITGQVNNPGVVILSEGSRIVDAIEVAGGITSKADISKVNLVYVLQDGMKVNIPSENDLKNNPDFEYITMSSGDLKNDENLSGSNTSNSDDSSELSSNSSSQENSSKNSIVNINTATQTELETLPGIGPSIALKIINYRKENGKFSKIEDIKNVSGIGDSKFESIKKFITV